MKSKETAVIKALGKYIHTAFKMREEHNMPVNICWLRHAIGARLDKTLVHILLSHICSLILNEPCMFYDTWIL